MQTIKFNQQEFTFPARDEADRSVIQEIFFWREYKSVENIITNCHDIIDGGAHIGAWSAYAYSFNPSAKIYALEPDTDNIQALKQSIKLNELKNVRIIPQALAATTGIRYWQKAVDSINHKLSPSDSQTGKHKVATVSLADLLKNIGLSKIDLLKLDIEGGEYELIDNWTKADLKPIKNIILEYHQLPNRDPQEIENFFRVNGFSVQRFPSRFDKQLGFMLARNKGQK